MLIATRRTGPYVFENHAFSKQSCLLIRLDYRPGGCLLSPLAVEKTRQTGDLSCVYVLSVCPKDSKSDPSALSCLSTFLNCLACSFANARY